MLCRSALCSLMIVALMSEVSAAQELSVPARNAPRVARNESYFGIHFDLHPNKSDTELGRDISAENIRDFLKRVRPDFIQYDCVGVPGYSGYATQIGWPAPGIVKDSLEVWRQVTREEGVALLIHYCVLWNQAAVEHHPDWAAVNAQGQPEKEILSIFSPFADQLLIPQLKEASTLYDLDGAWMDADAWIARLDYAPAALAEWKRQTGEETAPKSREEPRWAEWKMFQRREFEKYLSRYVAALHTHSPKFQIGCNWMYSLLAGVWPVGSPVDYLSGDYAQHNSTFEARAEARYFASNGKPWDLLAWGFNKHGLKCATQLKQEAAATIMQGGGWGIYYTPTRAGHIPEQITATAAEVADFCRARQAVSFRSTTVPQVALLQSAETYWDEADGVAFGRPGCREVTKGALDVLLESHYSVDMLSEHQLLPRLKEFPVVVVPDAYKLPDEFRQSLLNYVDNGGSLVLLGEKCARLFEPTLGVQFVGEPNQGGELVSDDGPSVMWTDGWQRVVVAGAKVIYERSVTVEGMPVNEPAATIVARGKGRIAAVYGPIAWKYAQERSVAIRDLVGTVMREAFPQPIVTTDAPVHVDLAVRRTRDGLLCVHFLNLARVQRGETEFPPMDPYPATGPFQVHLRLPDKPLAVRWEPAGQALEWTWRDGILTTVVPGVAIHSVLAVEEQSTQPVSHPTSDAHPDEPFRGQFSLEAAVDCLDDAALTWQRDKKCFACHSNYAFLETRPLISWKTPLHDELRAKLEELAAHPRQVSFRVMEGVMAASVLAQNDAMTTGKLHPVTRQALDYMWTLQRADGGFEWEKSSQPPSEIDDHFGATMALLGAGVAPDDYATTPASQAGLEKIRQYLLNTPPINLHQRSMLLLGSLHVDGIMTEAERQKLIMELFAAQKQDGGWNIVSLGNWPRHDGKPDDTQSSDGYGTGFSIYVLRQAGVPADDPKIRAGIGWLKANQRASGRWFTRSQWQDSRHLLSRQGTAWAIRALVACGER